MTSAIVAGVVTLAVAVVGAALSYASNRRLSQRQAYLARADAQLSELYGPMLATLGANGIAYRGFLAIYRPGVERNFLATEPSEEELRIWRLWVTHVLQAGNERIRELITTKSHLLIDDAMPKALLQFCAHTAGYRVTTERWKTGDYAAHDALIEADHLELREYLESSFAYLKQEQARLLALTRGPERPIR